MAKKIQERLRKAENAILTLKSQEGNNDSCYLSNALAISRFVTHLTKAMEGCNVPVQYAFVRQKGHIEPFLPYMASVVTLGNKHFWKILFTCFANDCVLRLRNEESQMQDLSHAKLLWIHFKLSPFFLKNYFRSRGNNIDSHAKIK